MNPKDLTFHSQETLGKFIREAELEAYNVGVSTFESGKRTAYYEKDQLKFTDSWFGSITGFQGRIAVLFERSAFWTMVYDGGIIRESIAHHGKMPYG